MIDDQVAAILDEVLIRRANGEPLSDEEVIERHPDLSKELAVGLEHVRRLDAASPKDSSENNTETIFVDCDMGPLSDGHRIGDRVAHYDLLELLGKGGFGSVWLALDDELGRQVALKIPRRETADVEKTMIEARTIARVSKHPHVVDVKEAKVDGETAYIASDYIQGVTLTDWLASSLPDLPDQYEVAQICQDIADALEHVHAAGVIHRDLKPDNVLMDETGAPKVTDFGLAVRAADPHSSEPGLVGTIPYMSPEQVLREPVDKRTDVYSIGVMLFELLTGQRPFQGDVESLLREIEENAPPLPRSRVAHAISRDLESICLKCLEKLPENRYQSAGELRDDLRRFLAKQPVAARPVTVFGRLSRWCRRHPSIPILSGTLLLALLVTTVVAGFYLQRELGSMQTTLEKNSQDGLENSATTIKWLLESRNSERFGFVAKAATSDELKLALLKAKGRPATPGKADKDVQDWIEQKNGIASRTRERENFFSWFVCDAKGVQVARLKWEESTLGQSYPHRSYFTGRAHDAPKRSPDDEGKSPDPIWTADSKPRLSDIFLSDTDTWVLAISAPVWDENQLIGVVGVFLTIREVLDSVVKTSKDKVTGKPTRFAYLLYERDGSGGARIIDHPLQNRLVAQKGQRIKNEVAEAAIPMDSSGDKRDPYEWVDWSDPNLTDEVTDVFGQDWLSASKPVVIQDSDDYPRLRVVVRESQDLVAGPVRRLRRNIVLFALSTLGLVAALLLPTWILIARRLLA